MKKMNTNDTYKMNITPFLGPLKNEIETPENLRLRIFCEDNSIEYLSIPLNDINQDHEQN